MRQPRSVSDRKAHSANVGDADVSCSNPLETGLARSTCRLADAVAALGHGRVDYAGLPPGACAYALVSHARENQESRTAVVTADATTAQVMADNLRFFGNTMLGLQPSEVLHYPASDTTPYLDVAPDRRGTMDRLGVLFHLSHALSWRFLVIPATALARRIAPREAIAKSSAIVRAEEELDRDAFLEMLADGGYLRVPVAEDPGTFSVRGGIIDVFPPRQRHPVRIELDDWLVLSIKRFDPDNQRTVTSINEVSVHPVRDTIRSVGGQKAVLARVRDLCDSINMPTAKTRALLDDLESGRTFYGLDGLLPAFHPKLETVFDYLPATSTIALVDPTAISSAVRDELVQANADREAKIADGSPAFPNDDLYQSEQELHDRMGDRNVAAIHTLAVSGALDASESPLAAFETTQESEVRNLAADDQSMLVAALRAHRATHGTEDALRPIATQVLRWLDSGMRVVCTARTHTQADRLRGLLRDYGVPVKKEPLSELPPRTADDVHVAIGGLRTGFVFATEAIVFLTEEEIFGSRARKRRTRAKQKRIDAPFIQDLRELHVGDFVVHSDHGVGKYLGLEQQEIAQSAFERLQGVPKRFVEALVVEYVGGDKLFVPVTRLNQIQKFSGQEGQKPKLDKLGGQSFTKKKDRVKKAVRKLAEDLLKLYAERAAAVRPALPDADRAYAEFEATFPFDETPDQARAIDDVLSDLEGPQPMDRLICGDVGFGKTEVAIRAAFRVAMSGRQVALLCPTTVLAQQHFLNFRERLRNYPLKVNVLSRFAERKAQADVVRELKAGTVDVVVGTHRLLSKDVHFKNLGLLVVDEEQRFGVGHKERIKALRTQVDVLTLSATPIPRTLQLALGGMRDLSLITTAPVDRRAVRTYACRWDKHAIKEAIQRELSRGGQVFFVYNRIEGLYERAHRLQELLPDARIAVAHGQMKEQQLERTMTDFVDGQYDILCSTAIIESGIDIPRANTMIIDRADIFGLSQLYQLRGRVGRSQERAYCYLITPPPTQMSDDARERIQALERFTELGSGFQVASLDMELRGVGDLLGAEQSGSVSLVGFELFVHMLESAVAQLRGQTVHHEVDTELTLDVEHYLPDDYIDDVGLRLSFYKRFASAPSVEAVGELAEEMEDRFGPPPPPAATLIRAMQTMPELRKLRALGCEASSQRVTLHLKEDTPLDPAKVMSLVNVPRSAWKLSPDLKLTRRFENELSGDAIDRIREIISNLKPLWKSTTTLQSPSPAEA